MTRPGPNVTSDADTQPGSDSLFPTGFSGGGALVRQGSVGTGEIADGSVAGADLNLASVTAALNGTYATQAQGTTTSAILAVNRYKRSPLAGIFKAASGPYRILQIGTSIANGVGSPNHRMVQALTNAFGATGMSRIQCGIAGGSNTNAKSGWDKQPYGGLYYVRMRGNTGSSNATVMLDGYGDQIVVEWSQEADSQAATLVNQVDGTTIGTFGSSGTQKYGQRTVFSVTRGAYRLQLNPPASNYAYVEALEIRDSTRRGVETIDATIGGSSLSMATTNQTATAPQVSPVSIQTGVGLEALFGRDDVDLILMSFTVNDAGANPGDPTGADYRAWLEQGVAAAKRRGTPVVLIIEPAGHYAMTNDGGSTALHTRFEAVKAHQFAVAAANSHVFVSDWDTPTRITDIPTYASTWGYTASSINTTAGTYSGDFIHPDYTVTNSAQDIGSKALAQTLGVSDLYPAATKSLTDTEFVGGYGGPSQGVLPLVAGASPRIPCAVYRNTGATNVMSGTVSSITSAGTSDTVGKYLLCSNRNIGLGGTTGTKWWVVAKVGPDPNTNGGAVSIQASGTAVRFYDINGTQVFTGINGLIQFTGMSTGTYATVCMLVDQSTANNYLTFNGRLYEIAQTTQPNPTLVTAP